MLDLVSRRLLFFVLSTVVIVPGLISLAIPPGLNLGIEFTSGSTMTVDFEKPVEMAQVRDALEQAGQTDVILQRTGSDFFMRMREISPDQKISLEAQLTERLGPMVVRDFASVSAIVSKEIGRDAGFAIAAAAVGILLYVAWAFRRLAKPWRYGVSAIIALVHDVLVVLGLFSLLGRLFGVQVDATFIAAILAVVGYSVNNTVVVYDRIRENTVRGISRDYVQVVNQSLVESLVRSLNTSLTTLFVVLALFLFGGETIRYFTLVFIIGITAGTYSSLFISSQLLVVWESKRWGRIWTRTA
ncbi:MAG: protein translocase subunit SecF [Dehalococcoidia bacterium]|nr:protein translocase subunit SecF [Dehalococcoidia bacterium]MDP6782799.1 protein translocase subunit SecF [Dehalococcoidia bacterium]